MVDLRICSQILNVPNEKNRCVVLSNGNGHLIDIIHPVYHITFLLCVYANVNFCTDAIPLPSDALPLTQYLSLSLQYLALFPSFSVHIKMHSNLF